MSHSSSGPTQFPVQNTQPSEGISCGQCSLLLVCGPMRSWWATPPQAMALSGWQSVMDQCPLLESEESLMKSYKKLVFFK